jgi:hypothetical protein
MPSADQHGAPEQTTIKLFFYYSSFQEKNIINLNFYCSGSEGKRRRNTSRPFVLQRD